MRTRLVNKGILVFTFFMIFEVAILNAQPGINIEPTLNTAYIANTAFLASWNATISDNPYGDETSHYFELMVSDDNGNSWLHFTTDHQKYHVSGLDPDVDTYYFKVRGGNKGTGTSEWSSTQEVSMTEQEVTVGMPAYNIGVSTITQSSFQLIWDSPYTNDVPWKIEIAIDPLFEYMEGYGEVVISDAGNEEKIENLEAGNTYYIRIRENDWDDAFYSMVVKVIMKPESPNVYKMGVTKNSFIGIWDEVNGATNYEVTLDDGDGFHKTYNTTETEYFFQGLPSGVELLVDVTAKNSSGSAKSEAITVDLIGGD